MARRRVGSHQEKTSELIEVLLKRITSRRANSGNVTYIIGNNGTGKSRILGELARRLSDKHPSKAVACIASSIHDRFTYGGHGRVQYLGARNPSNAVFHAAIERQLSRFILQAMEVDRRLLMRLIEVTNMDLSFELSEKSIETLLNSPTNDARSTMRLRQRAATRDLLAPRPLAILRRIANGDGRFEKLTTAQIPILLQYLDLNIDVALVINLPDGKSINFSDLSTGEQNRILLFAKVLSTMKEGTVFLIDEPEISLHLHWQMELHEKLMKLLSGLNRFHVVIATHAPIIISEAARFDSENKDNQVVVLRRQLEDGQHSGDYGPGVGMVTYQTYSFEDVASHEQLVLRYFQTAPYEAREVSVEIAETILRVAEGSEENAKAMSLLSELRTARGLSIEACDQINAAISLIERDLVTSLKEVTPL